jgi:peptidoglycan/xylan/chitin deacetylase (PgdA/CDA1 family)
MNFTTLWNRLERRAQRIAAMQLGRRPCAMRNREPLVSFTFDDFPRSALLAGGSILEDFGARGTYYTSFGLMGQTAPTGEIFTREDFSQVLERGHELGCHTFAHCHAGETASAVFEASILENSRTLSKVAPGAAFKTHSYPIGNPRVGTKKLCGNHFLACRGGGQTHNAATLDLNYLRAFFIEQSVDDFAAIQEAIDRNREAGGWLIFATHDVAERPTCYGCRPEFFARAVKEAVGSGARILPVSAALAEIGAPMSLGA